jgi:hypothetical protein
MPTRGQPPKISRTDDTITYKLSVTIPGRPAAQLIIRCDREGGIYVSVATLASSGWRNDGG